MQSYRGREAEQDQGYAVRDKEGGQSVDSLLLFFRHLADFGNLLLR